MTSSEETPKVMEDQKHFFKIPPIPRKFVEKKIRLPLCKVQISATAASESATNQSSSTALSSPCVQLGQKRPTFPFSPAVSTPKSSGSGGGAGSRFFCADDWQTWKENIEKFAVTTCVGPRPPTPPSWVATPHRSGLLRSRQGQTKSGIRRRLISSQLAKEKTEDEKMSDSVGVNIIPKEDSQPMADTELYK